MTHIHLIGIGGTGLSAIARVLHEMGYRVTGSDRAETPFVRDLRSAGVTISVGHHPENITGADIVMRSSAIPDDNPEVMAAHAAGIPVLKRADFLGQIMSGKTGIAVAGTHGKTTTTAMLAWVLTALKQDPSFIVGSALNNLGVNAHAGKGPTFVIEADEYDRMFLGLEPIIEVVTNVEHDHPDCFPTPADFHDAFVEFVKLLPAEGTLVACAEDRGARALMDEAARLGKKVLPYGLSDQLSVTSNQLSVISDQCAVAQDLKVNEKGGFSFETIINHQSVIIHLQVPGEHNVRNALAAMAVIGLLGLPPDEAAQALGEYTGAGRRFEVRGEAGGIVFIDDYAHHPTEIRATLAAAKSRYPGRRIVAVWQPHTYSRTQALFEQFVQAFADADEVIATEIYAAREPKQEYSAQKVVSAMSHPAVHFIPDLAEVSDYLAVHLRPGDVLLMLSAGDADKVSAEVLERRVERNAQNVNLTRGT